MSLVSVIVPVYNAEQHLSRCLDSIRAQTYADFEVIMIDDGSTDGSAAICRRYCDEDERFRLINQKNAGPSAARNRGIDAATSKYLSFVDADDYIEPHMLDVFVRAAEESDADLTMCGYIIEHSDGRTSRGESQHEPGLYEGQACREMAIHSIDKWEGRILPYSWVRFVKRECLESPSLRFNTAVLRSEDYLFWVQIFFRIQRVRFIAGQYLYHYVMNGESVTHRYLPGFWNMARIIHGELLATLPAEKEIQRNVNLALVQYAYVGLHIAAQADDYKTFKKDLDRVLCDETMKRALKQIPIGELPATFRRYYLIFKLRLHGFLRLLYTYKFIRHRCRH